MTTPPARAEGMTTFNLRVELLKVTEAVRTLQGLKQNRLSLVQTDLCLGIVPQTHEPRYPSLQLSVLLLVLLYVSYLWCLLLDVRNLQALPCSVQVFVHRVSFFHSLGFQSALNALYQVDLLALLVLALELLFQLHVGRTVRYSLILGKL